jgi:hypothetical protein
MATALARKNIFCIRHWHPLPIERGFPAEEDALAKLVHLPCDHRYGREAMRRVAEEVLRVLAGESDLGLPSAELVCDWR